MRRAETVASSYQVTLRGSFGPSFLAAFAAMGADHAATSSAFVVTAPADRGMSDIVRMLQARGLVLLGIRRIPTRDRTPAGPEPLKEHRCPSTQQPEPPHRRREHEAPRPG